MKKKIMSVLDKTEKLLRRYPELRDNNRHLQCGIWYEQLQELGYNPDTISFKQFRELYKQENYLSDSDSTSRASRKIQEMKPELRGAEWESRQKHQKEVKDEIKRIELRENYQKA